MNADDVTQSAGENGGFRAPSIPMADLFPYPATHRITAVEAADGDPQILQLAFDDGALIEWHALALRDCCPCTDCRHPSSLERTVDHLSYPLDLIPTEASVTATGDLRIVWSDGGHVSVYTGGWLRAGGRPEFTAGDEPPTPWGRDLALPRFRFDAVMTDDGALLAWLETLRRTGLTYLTEAPGEDGTVARLIHRIAHIRETNFGVVFNVEALVDTISNAYTAIDLPLHVDLPTREYQPGFQFLHCLQNDAAGGQSLYGDGLHMANELRAQDPEAYRIMTTVPVVFRYHDVGADYLAESPMIVVDRHGAFLELRFNPALLTAYRGPADQAKAFYRAYRALVAMTSDPRFQFQTRMTPGEIACFDNRRVLHGRRAFEPTTGMRHLQGAYLEREDLVSRILTLRRAVPGRTAAAEAA